MEENKKEVSRFLAGRKSFFLQTNIEKTIQQLSISTTQELQLNYSHEKVPINEENCR